MIRHEYVQRRLVESMTVGLLVIAILVEPTESVVSGSDTVMNQGTRGPPSHYVVVDLTSPIK